MILTVCNHEVELDEEDPWLGILEALMFAKRAKVNSTNRAKPMQLVFCQDAILNIKHKANWMYIKSIKDKISQKIIFKRTKFRRNTSIK